MRVTIRVIGMGLPAGNEPLTLELEGGATIEAALREAAAAPGTGLTSEQLTGGTLLLNNRRAYLTDSLHDGDVLHVLRTLEGG